MCTDACSGPAAAGQSLALLGEVGRGSKSAVTVNLSVGQNAVTMRRLTVRVRGTELIELSQTISEEKDAKGKQVVPSRTVNVRKEEVFFEREFTIVAGQELAGGSHHKLSGDIELPANLFPPTVTAKYSRIKVGNSGLKMEHAGRFPWYGPRLFLAKHRRQVRPHLACALTWRVRAGLTTSWNMSASEPR